MNIALIGHGMVAPTYLQAIEASAGLNLSVICGRSAERLSDFAKRHDCKARFSTDISEVAEDPQIDFAIVATPPNARASIIEKLAARAKPILLEKPIERSLTAAHDIVQTCETAQTPLAVMFQHRARAPAQRLKQMLNDNALGEIAAVEITVPWWRDQAYYDTPGRGSYAQDGGGVLITQAIHTLDLALHLLGPVGRVQAMARRTKLHSMEAEDFVTAGLEFRNGITGSLFASTASFPGRSEEIILHGTDASARLEPGGLTIHWRDGRVEADGGQATSGGGADPMAFTHAWHQAVIEDFANSLKTGAPPLCTGREALQVHALIDGLIRSSDTGTSTEIDHDSN